MKEITYQLQNPFEYAFKGDQRTAEFITLFAPTVENLGYVAKLKQGFMQAITSQRASSEDVQKAKESNDSLDDLGGGMIMAMISMSDIDYSHYLQTAKAVFADTGVALVDGEELLKKVLMNKMSVDDLESMTGEYLKAFILTSALETMQA